MSQYNPEKEGALKNRFGEFEYELYRSVAETAFIFNPQKHPQGAKRFRLRLQSTCIHYPLADSGCDCSEQIEMSYKLLRDSSPDDSPVGLMLVNQIPAPNFLTQLGNVHFDIVIDYDLVKGILRNWDIDQVILVTHSKRKLRALNDHNVTVIRTHSMFPRVYEFSKSSPYFIDKIKNGLFFAPIQYETGDGEPVTVCDIAPDEARSCLFRNPKNDNDKGRITRLNRPLPKSKPELKERMLVLGDLNVDHFEESPGRVDMENGELGGSALHPAIAFGAQHFMPVILGSVGQDRDGDFVVKALKACSKRYAFNGLVYRHEEKKTGSIVTVKNNMPGLTSEFIHSWETVNNANDYQQAYLEDAIRLMALDENDWVYISAYLFLQKAWNVEACMTYLQTLAETRARIVIDIPKGALRHFGVKKQKEYVRWNEETFEKIINSAPKYAVAADKEVFERMTRVYSTCDVHGAPNKDFFETLFNYFSDTRHILCRYADPKEDDQKFVRTFSFDNGSCSRFQSDLVDKIPEESRLEQHKLWNAQRGGGDRLTARVIRNLLAETVLSMG